MLRLPGRLALWAALGSSLQRIAASSPAAQVPPLAWPVCRRRLWTSAAAACSADPAAPDAAWQTRLTPLQYAVTRRGETEPPFSGHLPAAAAAGDRYGCVCCGAPLFRAGDKFDSGSGWPSFRAAAGSAADGGPDGTSVTVRRDTSHGMVRDEALCRHCGAHLGHVFGDGPPPTRLRYCINAAALRLLENTDGGAD